MAPSDPQPDPVAAPARTPLRAYGLRVLVVLFVLNMVDEVDRAVLAVALDDIRRTFGVSDAVVGLLPLAVILVLGLVTLPAGAWADRWSRRNVLALGALVWGGAGLLAAGAQSFVVLFLSRALLGVGQGTIAPTHLSLLADSYPVSVRGRVLGYHRSANSLGQVIGAAAGGIIIAAAGWRWAFVAAAVAGLAMGVYALTLREPARGEADVRAAVELEPGLAAFLREPEDRWSFRQSAATIMGTATLRLLILANATWGFALVGVLFWLPTYFERRFDYGPEAAGLALAAVALASFAGSWYGGPLADRLLGRGFAFLTRVGAAGALALAVCWSVGMAVPVPGVTIALYALGSVIAGLAVPGLVGVVAACSHPRIRAQSFAAFGLALAICGASVAPVLVGLVSDALRGAGLSSGDALRASILVLQALVMLLGTWLIWRASRTAQRDVEATLTAFFAERAAGERAGEAAARAAVRDDGVAS